MSMTVSLRRAGQGVLAGLSGQDEDAFEFVSPSDAADPAYHDGTILDIDKAWHAINFLLSSSHSAAATPPSGQEAMELAWNSELPSGFLLAGAEVGAEMEYGAVRVLLPAEVAGVQAFLGGLPDDFIETALDFDRLQEASVYPDIWDRRDSDDVQYVSSYFQRLREFVATAAEYEEGIAQVMI